MKKLNIIKKVLILVLVSMFSLLWSVNPKASSTESILKDNKVRSNIKTATLQHKEITITYDFCNWNVDQDKATFTWTSNKKNKDYSFGDRLNKIENMKVNPGIQKIYKGRLLLSYIPSGFTTNEAEARRKNLKLLVFKSFDIVNDNTLFDVYEFEEDHTIYDEKGYEILGWSFVSPDKFDFTKHRIFDFKKEYRVGDYPFVENCTLYAIRSLPSCMFETVNKDDIEIDGIKISNWYDFVGLKPKKNYQPNNINTIILPQEYDGGGKERNWVSYYETLADVDFDYGIDTANDEQRGIFVVPPVKGKAGGIKIETNKTSIRAMCIGDKGFENMRCLNLIFAPGNVITGSHLFYKYQHNNRQITLTESVYFCTNNFKKWRLEEGYANIIVSDTGHIGKLETEEDRKKKAEASETWTFPDKNIPEWENLVMGHINFHNYKDKIARNFDVWDYSNQRADNLGINDNLSELTDITSNEKPIKAIDYTFKKIPAEFNYEFISTQNDGNTDAIRLSNFNFKDTVYGELYFAIEVGDLEPLITGNKNNRKLPKFISGEVEIDPIILTVFKAFSNRIIANENDKKLAGEIVKTNIPDIESEKKNILLFRFDCNFHTKLMIKGDYDTFKENDKKQNIIRCLAEKVSFLTKEHKEITGLWVKLEKWLTPRENGYSGVEPFKEFFQKRIIKNLGTKTFNALDTMVSDRDIDINPDILKMIFSEDIYQDLSSSITNTPLPLNGGKYISNETPTIEINVSKYNVNKTLDELKKELLLQINSNLKLYQSLSYDGFKLTGDLTEDPNNPFWTFVDEKKLLTKINNKAIEAQKSSKSTSEIIPSEIKPTKVLLDKIFPFKVENSMINPNFKIEVLIVLESNADFVKLKNYKLTTLQTEDNHTVKAYIFYGARHLLEDLDIDGNVIDLKASYNLKNNISFWAFEDGENISKDTDWSIEFIGECPYHKGYYMATIYKTLDNGTTIYMKNKKNPLIYKIEPLPFYLEKGLELYPYTENPINDSEIYRNYKFGSYNEKDNYDFLVLENPIKDKIDNTKDLKIKLLVYNIRNKNEQFIYEIRIATKDDPNIYWNDRSGYYKFLGVGNGPIRRVFYNDNYLLNLDMVQKRFISVIGNKTNIKADNTKNYYKNDKESTEITYTASLVNSPKTNIKHKVSFRKNHYLTGKVAIFLTKASHFVVFFSNKENITEDLIKETWEAIYKLAKDFNYTRCRLQPLQKNETVHLTTEQQRAQLRSLATPVINKTATAYVSAVNKRDKDLDEEVVAQNLFHYEIVDDSFFQTPGLISLDNSGETNNTTEPIAKDEEKPKEVPTKPVDNKEEETEDIMGDVKNFFKKYNKYFIYAGIALLAIIVIRFVISIVKKRKKQKKEDKQLSANDRITHLLEYREQREQEREEKRIIEEQRKQEEIYDIQDMLDDEIEDLELNKALEDFFIDNDYSFKKAKKVVKTVGLALENGYEPEDIIDLIDDAEIGGDKTLNFQKLAKIRKKRMQNALPISDISFEELFDEDTAKDALDDNIFGKDNLNDDGSDE